jgi:hypothetical protein
MQKNKEIPKDPKTATKGKATKEKPEKEFDADNEVHKTSPDLIQKEDHHLPVDDEVKNG